MSSTSATNMADRKEEQPNLSSPPPRVMVGSCWQRKPSILRASLSNVFMSSSSQQEDNPSTSTPTGKKEPKQKPNSKPPPKKLPKRTEPSLKKRKKQNLKITKVVGNFSSAQEAEKISRRKSTLQPRVWEPPIKKDSIALAPSTLQKRKNRLHKPSQWKVGKISQPPRRRPPPPSTSIYLKPKPSTPIISTNYLIKPNPTVNQPILRGLLIPVQILRVEDVNVEDIEVTGQHLIDHTYGRPKFNVISLDDDATSSSQPSLEEVAKPSNNNSNSSADLEEIPPKAPPPLIPPPLPPHVSKLKKKSAQQQMNYTVMVVNGKRKYQCNLCEDKVFFCRTSISHHYLSSHMRVRFRCVLCDRSFTRQSSLRKHQVENCKYGPKNRRPRRTKEMQPVLSNTSSAPAEAVPMPDNGTEATTYGHVTPVKIEVEKNDEVHVVDIFLKPEETCHGEEGNNNCEADGETMECDICHLQVRDLSTHLYTVHFDPPDKNEAFSEPLRLPPSTKNKKIPNKSKSVIRYGCSLNLESNLWACETCHKEFSSKPKAQRHYCEAHLRQREECYICGETFSNKQSCLRHFNSVHLQVRFKCEHCGVSFSRKGHLIRHQGISTCGAKTATARSESERDGGSEHEQHANPSTNCELPGDIISEDHSAAHLLYIN